MNKHFSTKSLALMGVMTAVCVISSRYLAINVTPSIRFSMTNGFLVLSGFWFGPLGGALVGILADVIGSFLNGYTPFLLLTVSPLLVGFLSGLVSRFSSGKRLGYTGCILTVSITTLLTTVLYSSWALSVLYGNPYFPVLISRIPQAIVAVILNSILVCALYRSPVTRLAAEEAHA